VRALPAGAKAVKSNFGEAAYDGPCPPPGSGVHHYHFAIWALAQPHFEAKPDGSARELQAELQKVALAHAEIVGSVAAVSR
jgi:hypothetical protein